MAFEPAVFVVIAVSDIWHLSSFSKAVSQLAQASWSSSGKKAHSSWHG
jgi:hypothetical protein